MIKIPCKNGNTVHRFERSNSSSQPSPFVAFKVWQTKPIVSDSMVQRFVAIKVQFHGARCTQCSLLCYDSSTHAPDAGDASSFASHTAGSRRCGR
uniref:Uncharacterized protein n=1 Tax=Anopheles arabiensis TaxID=7173 RepID=A0A1I8JT20_ANOAR